MRNESNTQRHNDKNCLRENGWRKKFAEKFQFEFHFSWMGQYIKLIN